MTDPKKHTSGDMSLLALFRTELENHCAVLSDKLLQLEQTPGDSEILEALMRAVHSAKGAARVVEFDPVVRLAHAMEDVFVNCQQGKFNLARPHIDSLFSAVDLLGEIGHVPEQELDTWLVAQTQRFEVLVERISGIGKGADTAEEHTAAALPKQEPVPGSIEAPLPNTPETDIRSVSMLDLFRTEVDNNCEILTENLLLLEKEPTSPDHLEALMRGAHSIKGAARIVDIKGAMGLAHAMEDIFIACQYRRIAMDSELINLLFKGVDLLHQIANTSGSRLDNYLHERQSDLEKLVLTLQRQSGASAAVDTAVYTAEAGELSLSSGPPEIKSGIISSRKKPARRAEDKDGVRSIRISAENMSRLMGLAGEMLIESGWLPRFSSRLQRLKTRQDDFLHMLDEISDAISSGNLNKVDQSLFLDIRKKIVASRNLIAENIAVVEAHSRQAVEISHRLYHEAIASRMLPFSHGISGFPRMVRDLAAELGKKANLEIIGAETPVDRDILEKIESPLTHLLRNALDHGIETMEVRQKEGKTEEATILLEARHRAGMLSVIVADDGAGIDVEKIRQTVINRKLVAEDIALALSSPELIEFLFLPHFSTKETVSEISGRGVGLDVVRNAVHEVRGLLSSFTEVGKGTRFELQLPLTLSVMRALIVEICREPYGLPLVNIDHVVKVPRNTLNEVQGRQYFTFNDRRVGLVAARQVLQVSGPHRQSEGLDVIIFHDRMNQYGLIVDHLWGIRDLVIQTLDKRLGKVKDINSASVLEDGTPVLILDVEDLVRSMDILISDNRVSRIEDETEESADESRKHILVVDDSITVREVERKMLTAKGYLVDVAVDGKEALSILRDKDYDLMVTDVDMPRMNGIELVKAAKTDARLSSLPVIIVSYKDREEDRNLGLEAGADYYLTKDSFQNEALVDAVRDLIGDAS
jgi:two-component system sensor histidine kinase and response regulator WspE